MLSRQEQKKRRQHGIDIAKRQGKFHGRKEKLTTDNPALKEAFHLYFRDQIMDRYDSKFIPFNQIASRAGFTRQTLYRKLKQYHPKPKDYLSLNEFKQWIKGHRPNSKLAKSIRKAEKKRFDDQWYQARLKEFGRRYNIKHPHIGRKEAQQTLGY